MEQIEKGMETLQNLQTCETTQVISTKEKKNIEDAHGVLLALLPALPPPVDMVDDTDTMCTDLNKQIDQDTNDNLESLWSGSYRWTELSLCDT